MNLKPLILGHRGASALAPENTLAAFSRAIRDGADGIEFDVRLSRDKVPVVIHDASLKRTGLMDRLVSDLTAAELQKIDVGRSFARAPDGDDALFGDDVSAHNRLPLLAEVFELYRANEGLLYVEMKCEPTEGVALATEVVRVIHESEFSHRVVVESFDFGAIAEVKRIDANVRTAALFEPKISNPISALRPLTMINLARECGADELALHHLLARASFIEKAQAQGFEVVVWTVDDPKWVTRAASMSIKALIANNPAPMIQYRNQPR
ncbi:MAG TPA: glycerophosphodiester phosphodiesterase family protein [Pyrinomonadaceae bacterium]|nr:glycerophosphodiester phosphodiesterase family protein [Pyrinomonadaceae bacterium]